MIKKFILFLLLVKICLNTECQDGTICPGNQKCCSTIDGTSCCPYSSGVCCSDMKHCCPSGYTCSNNGSCRLISEKRRNFEDDTLLPEIPIK